MRLRVRVTAEHICRGRPGSPLFGPISLAVRQAAGPPCTPVVEAARGLLIARGRRWEWRVPVAVQFFAACFDLGLPVRPIEFDADLARV